MESVAFKEIVAAFETFDVSRDRNIKHIYAVQYDDGIVKIGITKNPKSRLYALSRMRGDKHNITKVYISGLVNHAYRAEKRTTQGLVASYKSEFFDIPFEHAVERIQSVAGKDIWYCSDNPEYIRHTFPNTERIEDGMNRVFDTLITLCGIKEVT